SPADASGPIVPSPKSRIAKQIVSSVTQSIIVKSYESRAIDVGRRKRLPHLAAPLDCNQVGQALPPAGRRSGCYNQRQVPATLAQRIAVFIAFNAIATAQPGFHITASQKAFWSFQPLRKPELPKETTWARTPIDRFILARIEQAGV